MENNGASNRFGQEENRNHIYMPKYNVTPEDRREQNRANGVKVRA